jgi:hypothetical protein
MYTLVEVCAGAASLLEERRLGVDEKPSRAGRCEDTLMPVLRRRQLMSIVRALYPG